MKPSKSRTLIDKDDIRIAQAKLATEIGLNENIFLQQIHYWLKGNEEREHNYRDGRYWTFNSYPDWQKKSFPFWSISTVRRTVKSLEKQGLITTTSKYNKKKYDETKWYTINYDKLKEIELKAYGIEDEDDPSEQGGNQNEQGGVQNEQGGAQNEATPDQNEQTNTKDSPKGSSKDSNNNNKKAETKNSKLLVDNFQKAFGKEPNSFQKQKLSEFIDKGGDFELMLKTIEYCALGGHNQTFFFRRLDILIENGIYKKEDLKKIFRKDNVKAAAGNSKKTENNEVEDDYKWKDFFIDFDKYKE